MGAGPSSIGRTAGPPAIQEMCDVTSETDQSGTLQESTTPMNVGHTHAGRDGQLPVPPEVWKAILDGYTLPLLGTHGVVHWARVLENGRRIAGPSGADLAVVELFALFHDARRSSEGEDPEHGPRGAELARALRSLLPLVTDTQLEQLCVACEQHTHTLTHDDPTVRACFDADRLDLARVGVTPDPRLLCTDAARDPEVLAWATARGRERVVPAFVHEVWLR